MTAARLPGLPRPVVLVSLQQARERDPGAEPGDVYPCGLYRRPGDCWGVAGPIFIVATSAEDARRALYGVPRIDVKGWAARG